MEKEKKSIPLKAQKCLKLRYVQKNPQSLCTSFEMLLFYFSETILWHVLEKLEATVTLLKMTELLHCAQLEAQLTKFS